MAMKRLRRGLLSERILLVTYDIMLSLVFIIYANFCHFGVFSSDNYVFKKSKILCSTGVIKRLTAYTQHKSSYTRPVSGFSPGLG